MHLVPGRREMGPWEQRCQGKSIMVESHRSFPKAGYGEQAAFPRKKLSPFLIALERPALPQGAHAQRGSGQSPSRGEKGVAEDGRVEPRPRTAVSRVSPCTLLFPSCIHPIPAAGTGMQRTMRVRLELRCGHMGLILAKEEQTSQVHNYSYAGQGRKEGNR